MHTIEQHNMNPYSSPRLTTFGTVRSEPTTPILTLLELANFHLSAIDTIPQNLPEERLAVEERRRRLREAKAWLNRQLPTGKPR
jgi:hypothetical protein